MTDASSTVGRSRPLTLVLAAVAALALLLALAVGVAIARFDGEAIKPWLVQQAQTRWQRDLVIAGPLRLSLWPTPAVAVGAWSLSGPGGGSAQLRARGARLALGWDDLLRGRTLPRGLEVDGLRLEIVRDAAGGSNFDDLLGPTGQPDAQAPAGAPGRPFRLALTDAEVMLDDRAQRRRLTLRGVDLTLEPDGQLQARAKLQADRPNLDGTLVLSGRWMAPDHTLAVESLRFDGRVAAWPQAALQVSGEGRLDKDGGWLARLDSLELTGGGEGGHRLELGGTLKVDAQGASAALDGRLDGQALKLTLSRAVAGKADAVPAMRVELAELDLDAWAAQAQVERSGQGGRVPPREAPELHADALLQVGRLTAAGLTLTQVQAELQARGPRLELTRAQARLYDGRATARGSWRLTPGGPLLALQAQLDGVQLGPALHDLGGGQGEGSRVEGRADVRLGLRARGDGPSAWRRSLDGQGRVDLRDGRVRGLNLAEVLRRAAAALGRTGAQGSGGADQGTDFSELGATLRLDQGVLSSEDLQGKSPLLRLAGRGQVDLVREPVDARLDLSVVPTLQGQGGPELQALRGRTLPVKVAGPLAAPEWRIDAAALARETVKRKLLERLEPELGDRLKGLFGR